MSVSSPRGEQEPGQHEQQRSPLFIAVAAASLAFLDDYPGSVLWLMSIKSSNTQTNPDHNHLKPTVHLLSLSTVLIR